MSSNTTNPPPNNINILWEEKEARAVPILSPAPFTVEIIFDGEGPAEAQVWTATNVKDTPYFSLYNAEYKVWAYARGKQVVGSTDFDIKHCSWEVNRETNGKYTLKASEEENAYWTVKETASGGVGHSFLEPYDRSKGQMIDFFQLEND